MLDNHGFKEINKIRRLQHLFWLIGIDKGSYHTMPFDNAGHLHRGMRVWSFVMRSMDISWVQHLDSPDTFNFHIEINTPSSHPDERVRRIQILRNSRMERMMLRLQQKSCLTGQKTKSYTPVIEDHSAKYFLLQVHHANDKTENGELKPKGSTISARSGREDSLSGDLLRYCFF